MGGPNWSMDDGNPIGWADVDEAEILAGIKAGLDAGVTHFDNADVYGNGRAERMLRDCLKKLGVSADTLVIATKVGHFKGTAEHAYEPRNIRHQCEVSLSNLGVEAIDIYYFHHGWFAADGERGNLHDAAGEMRKLVDEGKVRAVGQSAYSDEDFARAIPVVKPDVLQSWANMMQDNFIRPGAPVQKLGRVRLLVRRLQPAGPGPPARQVRPREPTRVREGRHPRPASGPVRSGRAPQAQAQAPEARRAVRHLDRGAQQRRVALRRGPSQRVQRDPGLPQRAAGAVQRAGRRGRADDRRRPQVRPRCDGRVMAG